MNHRNGLVRHYTVYTAAGEPLTQASESPDVVAPPRTPRQLARLTTLQQVMSNEVTCALPDLALEAVLDLMIRHRIGCLPIVDRVRRPLGIVTKMDLVELVGAQILATSGPIPDDLRSRTADDIMMPIALTLPETSSVADAAKMMSLEDTHHVLVVTVDGRLSGVVSTHDIVTWLVDTEHPS